MKDVSLEERCQDLGGFNIELLGNVYCSLFLSRKIECSYISKEKDKNDLYYCKNPVYQSLCLDSEYKSIK